MAWTERTLPQDETIKSIIPPPIPPRDPQEYSRLKQIFKDMPPFIKITSRRARKTLAKYEELKQRQIEALRNNATFKFVMMVAGLTNEPIQKYWKGNDASPFSDSAVLADTKISKEDLQMLVKRARENAFADLHQFCGPINAIPMYRIANAETYTIHKPPSSTPAQTPIDGGRTFKQRRRVYEGKLSNVIDLDDDSDDSDDSELIDVDRQHGETDSSSSSSSSSGFQRPRRLDPTRESLSSKQKSQADNQRARGGVPKRFASNLAISHLWEPHMGAVDPSIGSSSADEKVDGYSTPPKRLRSETPAPEKKTTSENKQPKHHVKYVYNMSDEEFFEFIQEFSSEVKKFTEELNPPKQTKQKDTEITRHSIRRYILGRLPHRMDESKVKREKPEDNGETPFPAHSHFRGQDFNARDNSGNPRRNFTNASRTGQARIDPFGDDIGDGTGAFQPRRGVWYNDADVSGEVPRSEIGFGNIGLNADIVRTDHGRREPFWEDSLRQGEGSSNYRHSNHSVDRIFDFDRVYGRKYKGKVIQEREGYDHPDEYLTLKRSNWWQWSHNQPIVRWQSDHAAFWFQRYVARWLTRESNTLNSNNLRPIDGGLELKDLEEFKNKYQGLFNNLKFIKGEGGKGGKWIRNLTGLRLSKFVEKPRYNQQGLLINNPVDMNQRAFLERRGDYEDDLSEDAGRKVSEPPKWNSKNPDKSLYYGYAEEFPRQDSLGECVELCEVPLDFVKTLFDERFSYWKHDLVLGEFEKRAMYRADQWLQKTPWAIGKIYLQPSMFAHMQEAHVAITCKFKKFSHLNPHDWFNAEKPRYFFAKLVALCIRTSAVLSNKKYGLDKAYMRINLEKKRIMHAIGKLNPPRRTPTTVTAFPRARPSQIDAWGRYEAARRYKDPAAAARALQDMN